MSSFCCSCNPQISPKATLSRNAMPYLPAKMTYQRPSLALRSMSNGLHGQSVLEFQTKLSTSCSFLGGSKVVFQQEFRKTINSKKPFTVSALWLPTSQIAAHGFTLGTVAVLPFYTLMILAPKAQLTRKTMESWIPYVMLGMLYGYLLYLSWTPETLHTMFASKYWLPELPGIAKMFSNEVTMSSAWIHLLAVDLFAARQVFHDGLKNNIETRHSVSLCLLFCPVGIAIHAITKTLMKNADRSD